jgi:hypothetical protein
MSASKKKYLAGGLSAQIVEHILGKKDSTVGADVIKTKDND